MIACLTLNPIGLLVAFLKVKHLQLFPLNIIFIVMYYLVMQLLNLKKNVFFIINEKDTLRFSNPVVLLGHETKLVVELLGVPSEIKSIYFQNAMFKDMPHNQMALIMLPEGFPKEQYILENSNKQAIHLELNQGKWFPVESDIQIFQAKNTVYLFLLLSFVIILVLFFKDSTKVFK